MSPHETGDIQVESEGTAASEPNLRVRQVDGPGKGCPLVGTGNHFSKKRANRDLSRLSIALRDYFRMAALVVQKSGGIETIV